MTEAAAHTPGPWTIELGDQTRTSEIWAGDMIVADVHGHVTRGSHADARLIAAAPELLEALQHIMRCIPPGGFAQIHDGSSTWAKIDAAITNATGGA